MIIRYVASGNCIKDMSYPTLDDWRDEASRRRFVIHENGYVETWVEGKIPEGSYEKMIKQEGSGN